MVSFLVQKVAREGEGLQVGFSRGKQQKGRVEVDKVLCMDVFLNFFMNFSLKVYLS